VPRAACRDPIYYRRRYPAEVIELCVRWYLTYKLSYRDLVAMMAERDVAVSGVAPVGSTDERQNGPDSAIARVETAPCHRAQKQGDDFRRRSQLTNADMSADGTSQKARH
jgi:hypothetical protein